MDSTTATDAANRYFDEAFKLSPNNPSSNGYGYVVATLAGLLIVFLVVIWFLYRDAKRDRSAAAAASKQARKDAGIQIDTRFDGLKTDISAGLDDIQNKVDAHNRDAQDKYALTREELARLKAIVEILQKGGK